MSVGPSDSRSDEASRDEHSDRAHALLPADIFSILSSWVHQRSDLRKHRYVVYGGRKTCT